MAAGLKAHILPTASHRVLITTVDDGNYTIPRLEELLGRGGHDRTRGHQEKEMIEVIMDAHRYQFEIPTSGLGKSF